MLKVMLSIAKYFLVLLMFLCPVAGAAESTSPSFNKWHEPLYENTYLRQLGAAVARDQGDWKNLDALWVPNQNAKDKGYLFMADFDEKKETEKVLNIARGALNKAHVKYNIKRDINAISYTIIANVTKKGDFFGYVVLYIPPDGEKMGVVRYTPKMVIRYTNPEKYVPPATNPGPLGAVLHVDLTVPKPR